MARTTEKSPPKRSRNQKAKTTPRSEAGTDINLSSLGREDLLQLQKDVDAALRSYERRKRDEALREMQLVAEKHGLSLNDVVRAAPGRSPQIPKYRHPENPGLTWSGRGRQPDWFKEAIDSGVSRDDLLIK